MTWEQFLKLCDEAVENQSNGAVSRHDLGEYVNPGQYWDDDFNDDDGLAAAAEYATDLLAEEGFPV